MEKQYKIYFYVSEKYHMTTTSSQESLEDLKKTIEKRQFNFTYWGGNQIINMRKIVTVKWEEI